MTWNKKPFFVFQSHDVAKLPSWGTVAQSTRPSQIPIFLSRNALQVDHFYSGFHWNVEAVFPKNIIAQQSLLAAHPIVPKILACLHGRVVDGASW